MTGQQQRDYLKELRPFILVSVAIFAASAVTGYFAAGRFPELGERFTDSIAEFIKTFKGLPKPQLAAAIFLNNSVKTLAAILLGLAFGIVPAFFLLLNGLVLGFVVNLAAMSRGWSSAMLSILPHGVIELAAVFLGTAVGLLLGDKLWRKLFRRSGERLRPELGKALRFYLLVIVPLLLIAALVEAFVTAALVAKG